jgi:hypothetical protein
MMKGIDMVLHHPASILCSVSLFLIVHISTQLPGRHIDQYQYPVISLLDQGEVGATPAK